MPPKQLGVTPRSQRPEDPEQQPTLAGPTSFLVQLATHACLSASSWSFRAFSSIWRGQAVSSLRDTPRPRPPC